MSLQRLELPENQAWLAGREVPFDVIVRMLPYLNPDELCALRRVSQVWFAIVFHELNGASYLQIGREKRFFLSQLTQAHLEFLSHLDRARLPIMALWFSMAKSDMESLFVYYAVHADQGRYDFCKEYFVNLMQSQQNALEYQVQYRRNLNKLNSIFHLYHKWDKFFAPFCEEGTPLCGPQRHILTVSAVALNVAVLQQNLFGTEMTRHMGGPDWT